MSATILFSGTRKGVLRFAQAAAALLAAARIEASDVSLVRHGAAPGVDSQADAWARARGIDVLPIVASAAARIGFVVVGE